MPAHLSLKAACLVFAVLLPACADAPQRPLVVDDQIVFQMFTAPPRPPGQGVTVIDARPDAEKMRTKIEGYVQLGDDLLSHPPHIAVQIALEEHLSSRGTSAPVRRALQENPVVLQKFQVLAVNQEIDGTHVHPGLPPGVAVYDLMLRNLIKVTTGASKMRMLISFDLGNFRFNSEGIDEFGATPGKQSTAIVFRKAMQHIFRRLEIAYGEPAGEAAR